MNQNEKQPALAMRTVLGMGSSAAIPVPFNRTYAVENQPVDIVDVLARRSRVHPISVKAQLEAWGMRS